MIEKCPKNIPSLPGVYHFRKEEEIIYIGKAKNLKKRIRSYFSGKNNLKDKKIIENATSIDYIVTAGEVEALILEENEIKQWKPRYNIMLKDDKRYPYVKVTVKERYPRVFFTRIVKNDDSLYFGPYPDVGAAKNALKTIREIFPIRTCSGERVPERACLNYYIGKCYAPCEDKITEKEYRDMIHQVIDFLRGKTEKIEDVIENKMWKASENYEYEKAAIYRNQLMSLREITKKQRMVLRDSISRDIIGMNKYSLNVCMVVFQVREGKLVGRENYFLKAVSDQTEEEYIYRFIAMRYSKTSYIPEEIVVPCYPADVNLLKKWLKADIKVPVKGDLKRLVHLADKNAEIELKREMSKPHRRISRGINELQEILALENPPVRIEGFDISNIAGTDSTGSCVVFINGVPARSEYRRFKIREINEINDPAMMGEVVSRRIKNIAENNNAPDLVLIDGGKTQLNAAMKAIEKLSESSIPVVALAKKMEELHLPTGKVLSLPRDSAALKLLMRIRNEAHRFALDYHRTIRKKRLTISELDNIPNIGYKRKISLIQHFGSESRLRSASIEDIKRVEGIGDKLAVEIYRALHPTF